MSTHYIVMGHGHNNILCRAPQPAAPALRVLLTQACRRAARARSGRRDNLHTHPPTPTRKVRAPACSALRQRLVAQPPCATARACPSDTRARAAVSAPRGRVERASELTCLRAHAPQRCAVAARRAACVVMDASGSHSQELAARRDQEVRPCGGAVRVLGSAWRAGLGAGGGDAPLLRIRSVAGAGHALTRVATPFVARRLRSPVTESMTQTLQSCGCCFSAWRRWHPSCCCSSCRRCRAWRWRGLRRCTRRSCAPGVSCAQRSPPRGGSRPARRT